MNKANGICGAKDYMNEGPQDDDVEQIQVNLEAVYEEALFLMEKLDLPQARERIQEPYEKSPEKHRPNKVLRKHGRAVSDLVI